MTNLWLQGHTDARGRSMRLPPFFSESGQTSNWLRWHRFWNEAIKFILRDWHAYISKINGLRGCCEAIVTKIFAHIFSSLYPFYLICNAWSRSGSLRDGVECMMHAWAVCMPSAAINWVTQPSELTRLKTPVLGGIWNCHCWQFVVTPIWQGCLSRLGDPSISFIFVTIQWNLPLTCFGWTRLAYQRHQLTLYIGTRTPSREWGLPDETSNHLLRFSRYTFHCSIDSGATFCVHCGMTYLNYLKPSYSAYLSMPAFDISTRL